MIILYNLWYVSPYILLSMDIDYHAIDFLRRSSTILHYSQVTYNNNNNNNSLMMRHEMDKNTERVVEISVDVWVLASRWRCFTVVMMCRKTLLKSDYCWQCENQQEKLISIRFKIKIRHQVVQCRIREPTPLLASQKGYWHRLVPLIRHHEVK